MTTSEELEREQQKLEEAYARAKAAIKAGQAPDPSDIFKIGQSKAADRRQRSLVENNGPTAKQIAERITEGVKDVTAGYVFHAKQGAKLGGHDSVMIAYASVPKGSPEIDSLNAKTNPMWHITEAKGKFWHTDRPSPAKVTIEHFRGSIQKTNDRYDIFKPEGKANHKANQVLFRAKTDTPDKIIKYLVDFIHKNKEAFKP